jgi:hypothetical protein
MVNEKYEEEISEKEKNNRKMRRIDGGKRTRINLSSPPTLRFSENCELPQI